MKIESIRLYAVRLPIKGAGYQLPAIPGAEITYAATTQLAHTVAEHLLLGATTIKVTKSLVDGGPVLESGRVRCDDGPGLGIEVKAESLGEPIATFE